MSRYVDATEQLVTEIFVRDIRRSVAFHQVSWEGHRLFLDETSAVRAVPGATLPPPSPLPLANVRVMVPNVDEYWQRANRTGARIITPLADRYYGLRDFTIGDPDGFGVRFATTLQANQRE